MKTNMYSIYFQPDDTHTHLLVIDEIGKMEFFSEPFKTAIRTIFNPSSNCTVLATIPVRRGDQLIESIRNNSQAKVWMVSNVNLELILEPYKGRMFHVHYTTVKSCMYGQQ